MPVPTLYDVTGFEASASPTGSTITAQEYDVANVGANGTLNPQYGTAGYQAGISSAYSVHAATGVSAVVSYAERDWDQDVSTVCIHLMIKFAAVPANLTYFCSLLDSANGYICSMGVNSTWKWVLYNNGNATTYTSTGDSLRAGEWYRIQLKIFCDAANGTIDWKTWNKLEPGINGISGINTKPGGLLRKYRVGVPLAIANMGSRYIDDIIVASDWVGNGHCMFLQPLSVPAANWSISGANTIWEAVRGLPWATGPNYIYSLTGSQEQQVGFTSVGSAIGNATILGLFPHIRLRRHGASAASVSMMLRSGVTDGTSAVMDAGSTTVTNKHGVIAPLDPATGAAWTLSAVNAVKVKLVKDASANQCDVFYLGLYVAFTQGGDVDDAGSPGQTDANLVSRPALTGRVLSPSMFYPRRARVIRKLT